jgi:hypothetical protein
MHRRANHGRPVGACFVSPGDWMLVCQDVCSAKQVMTILFTSKEGDVSFSGGNRLTLFSTSKILVMLSGAKHPVFGFQNEILHRFAPQSDTIHPISLTQNSARFW